MASPLRRPLPTPPPTIPQVQRLADIHGSSPYLSHYAYPPTCPPDVYDESPTTTLPGGTLLHQGFYDLLAMIPTPSPSRLLWGWNQQPVVAGPRYENIPEINVGGVSTPTSPISSPVPLKKGRRISKDMVSKPTGFVCVYYDTALCA